MEYKWTETIDNVYFEIGKSLDIEDLQVGEYFLVELRPQLTSNAKRERFYGRLLKKTEKTFTYNWYAPSSYVYTGKEKVQLKQMIMSETRSQRSHQIRIDKLHRVTIYEKTEEVEFSSNVDPLRRN
ncbi:hypothetical protein [Enterococcus entomosocium]|uniref:hypothetical protein n=1 Tax=Enterococcus entomosocium TaxID=3034352 RepID=UPI002648D72F|nr:hypothetical protein [Enterococcus entomosocium]